MEWFVLKNGDVLGPYETNGVAQMFGSEADVLIWGVPYQEWMSFTDWAVKMNLGAVARSHMGHQQPTPAVATKSTVESHISPEAAVAYVHNVSPAPAPVTTENNVSHHQPVEESFSADEPTAVYVHQTEASQPLEQASSEPQQDLAAKSDLPLEIPSEDTDPGLEGDGYTQALADLPAFNSIQPEAVSEYEEIEHTDDVQILNEGEVVEGTDKVELANMPSYAYQNERQEKAKEASFNELEALLGEALSQVEDGNGDAEAAVPESPDEVLNEASHDASAVDEQNNIEFETSDEEVQSDPDLSLEFDGPSMENEDATRIQSLFDSEVEGISASADSEDMDLSFDGQSEAMEDATRIDSLLDTEAKGASDQSQESDLGWSGSALEEDEATRVQFDDFKSNQDDESLDEDATRVSASMSEDDEDEATRVSASESAIDIEDLDSAEEIEVLEEEVFEAFSIEDDENDDEESTRVSSDNDQNYESSLEDEATRVSASSEQEDESFAIEDEDEATRVSASADQDDEGFDIEAEEEESTRVSASEASIEEDLSQFEDEVTRDTDDAFMQKLSDDIASEVVEIEDVEAQGQDGKVHDIASAKEVEQLKHIARQLKEEKVQNEDFIWYVAYEGESDGPLSLSQVLRNLDDYDVKDFVYVWREGFLDWKNLFDVPELSSGLGIGFRRHSRIQATGTVAVEFEGGTQIGQLDNLSESGIGIMGIDGLHLGDIVKVKVEADDLSEVMMIVARVRFVSESGLLGLSYEKDKYPENVNSIIDFVKAKSEKMAA